MKKLTAGIFATILGLTAMGAADAAIPTQNYVDEAVGSVRTTVTGIANNIATYGDIVTHNVSEFATAAQGTKADTALQAADLNGYAKTADLGTAAFTASTDYATAAQGTKADNAATTIATYGDIVTHNVSEFATAAQGTKADTALQAADLNGYAKTADLGTAAFTASTDYATAAQGTKADNAATTIATYGDIVTHNVSEFATAEQGTKADNAATTIATYGDIVTHNVSEFATAAQGTKADTALQAADLNGYAKTADLGTAAFTASTDYATAAQGTKADNAATTIATYGNIVTHNVSEFATAAQGTKADTALQAVACSDPNGCVLMADGTAQALVNTYVGEEN